MALWTLEVHMFFLISVSLSAQGLTVAFQRWRRSLTVTPAVHRGEDKILNDLCIVILLEK